MKANLRRRGPSVGLVVLVSMACASGSARAQDTDACINASERAVSLRKADKLIAARASLSSCAAPSCPDAVRTSCQQRLTAINQAIPSIVFVAKDGSGSDLAAVAITIDRTKYADRLDGSAIVLDPGEHEFRFEATGQAPVVKRFVLHQGEQSRREEIIVGASLPTATAAPPVQPAAPDQASTSGGSTQRTVGLVIGGVGVAGLAAGGVFGVLSLSAHSSYQNNCGSSIGAPAGACNAAGVSGQSDAATKGTISTIAFIGGGVAVAAGAVLFFTAQSGTPRAQVGIGPGSLFVRGEF